MAIVDFSELHVVESRAVLQKIHNAHGVCVSPAVFHGDFRGNVLQPCVEVDSSFFFQFQQCQRHKRFADGADAKFGVAGNIPVRGQVRFAKTAAP